MARGRIYEYVPLWGSWNVDEQIGRGSFGTVYKVTREELGHKYYSAVKIISIPSDNQLHDIVHTFGQNRETLELYFEDMVKNIVNEINILYTLSGNANIINYQDHKVIRQADTLGWDIMIRMEYVTSLRKYLEDNVLSRKEIIQMGIDICTALEICSRKGIIHRDIKDENIFVNSDGVFKLGDFGIAKELSQTGRAASMRGTPLFMAPEVARGEKYDLTVDLYSLGILLFKLLNHGRMPFMPPFPEQIRLKDYEEAFEKRFAGDPFPFPDQASVQISKIILKSCAFKPDDRYLTASKMKEDLESVLSSLSEEERREPITNLENKLDSSAFSQTSSIPSNSANFDNVHSIQRYDATEAIHKNVSSNINYNQSNSSLIRPTTNISKIESNQPEQKRNSVGNKKKRIFLIGISSILTFLFAITFAYALPNLTAESTNNESDQPKVSDTPQTSATTNVDTMIKSAKAEFPVEIVDATGAKVTLVAPPQAIIATNVWAGEILLDMVDNSRIAALSAWGDDPVLSVTAEKAAAVRKRVDISSPDSVVALNPDLVILDTFSNPDGSLSKTLTEAGIPVLMMETPTDFSMIADAILTLAQATGEIERGQVMVDEMNQTLDNVERKVAAVPEADRVTVMFYEDYYDPSGNDVNMLVAFGVGSPFQAIADAAGTVNVCNEANYSPIAKEKVIGEWQPQLLVIPSSTFDENFKAVEDGGEMLKTAIRLDPVLNKLPTVKNDSMVAIPDKYRASTSHYMVQAVVHLAREAYPNLFG